MKLPGVSRKIIGMCYNTSGSTSSFSQAGTSLTLRVPFIAQGHVNLCADATAAMIVQAWGFKTKNTKPQNDRGMFKGSSIENHTEIAEAGTAYWRKMQPPGVNKVEDLVNYLLQFGPLGAGVKSTLGGHAVALIGAYPNNQEVIVHDPWTGPFKIVKFESFKKSLTALTYLEKIGMQKMTSASKPWKS